MGIFASHTRLGPVAQGNVEVAPPDEGSSLIRSILTGAAIGGAVAGAYYYKAHPELGLAIAKRIAKAVGADVTSVSRGTGAGIFKEPLIGSAQDLVVLSHALDFLPKNKAAEALEELRRVSTPTITGEKHATVADLLSTLRGSKDPNADILHTALERLGAGTGQKPTDIAAQLHLGQNILNENGNIADYRRWTLEGLVQRGLEYSHENFKFPIVGFSPTDIFLHHSWSHTRKAAILGPQAAIRGAKLEQQALVIGNKAFTESGHVVEGNWKLFSTRSSLAESAAIVTGQFDVKPLHHFADDSAQGPMAKAFLELQRRGKLASMGESQRNSFLQRLEEAQNKFVASFKAKDKKYTLPQYLDDIKTIDKEFGHAGEFWENFIISPKWASNKSEVSKAFEYLERIHSGVPVLRTDAEGKPIRNLASDPLSFFEKIQLSIKGDVRGYHYTVPGGTSESLADAGEYVIGSGAKGPMKAGGFQDYIPGVHKYEDVVSTFDNFKTDPKIPAEFIVAEGSDSLFGSMFTSEAARSFWHFQARRPQKLFESLTGFGVRPDPSVLKTLLYGAVGTYTAFELIKNSMLYFNFLTFGALSKAGAGALAGVQLAGQALFTATGISQASQTMEDYFPGSISSFGSELLRTFAAPFIGAYLGGKMLKSMKVPKFLSAIIPRHMKDGEMSGRAVGAFAATALALSTVLLDPTKGYAQQLEEVTGDKRVAVRNARWWVAGRQPYEGDYIKYFDQSAVQKLWHAGSGDETTYGSQAAKWSHSWFPTPSNLFGLVPLVDPYYAERLNSEYRPYPVIDSAGGNLPLIGPTVQATVGQIAKPRIEYDIEGTTQSFGRYGDESAHEGERLGFTDTVAPPDARSPGAIQSILHHTTAKLQDYAGLYGFASKFVIQPLTGSGTGFGTNFEAEGSSRMTHQGEALRDMNLGGFMGTTEYMRRIYNDRDRSISYYNPLPNAMPAWLPGSGSVFREDVNFNTDFHTGDPYTKIEHGDIRLPGPGYASAYGYHGGENPDIVDIWSILSDVAPGSQARKYYEKVIEEQLNKGELDDAGRKQVERVREEAKERLGGRYHFQDYLNSVVSSSDSASDASTQYLSYLNRSMEERATNPVIAPLQNVWDSVTHTRVPGLAWAQGKFMHNRTPLEEYIATNVHGTPFSTWDKPIEGFIKPAYSEIVGSVAGSSYKPSEVQSREEIEEYYDKLKYLKARRLERLAQVTGQGDLASVYRKQQEQTFVGMDYGIGALNRNIFAAMPASTKPFVAGFAQASEGEQERILQYLPEYQKKLWQNIWANKEGKEVEYNSRADADKEVAEYFSQHALPSTESQVWNPDVSLDEFKLKTAEHEGVNYWSLGVSEAKAREYRTIGRADVLIDSSPFMQDMNMRNKLYAELGQTDDGGIVNMSNIRQTQEVRYNRRKDFQRQDHSLAGRF